MRRLNCEGPIVECATQRRLICVNSSAPARAAAEKSIERQKADLKHINWSGSGGNCGLVCRCSLGETQLLHLDPQDDSDPTKSQSVEGNKIGNKANSMRSQFSLSRAAISLMHKRCSPDHLKRKLKIIKKIIAFALTISNCENGLKQWNCLLVLQIARELGSVSEIESNVYRNAGTCSISVYRKTLAASCLDRTLDLWLWLAFSRSIDVLRLPIGMRVKVFRRENKSTIRDTWLYHAHWVFMTSPVDHTIFARLIKSETATQMYV